MKRQLLLTVIIGLAVVALSSGRPIAVRADGPGAAYVGAAGCICHADPVQKSWQKSKHARAFDLLKLSGQEKNEKCLPCHTTGYGKGGYGTADPAKVKLEGVQCEECHGPASVHVDTMDKTKINRTPSAVVCARCHMDRGIHARP